MDRHIVAARDFPFHEGAAALARQNYAQGVCR
jgi:hypothetical protein